MSTAIIPITSPGVFGMGLTMEEHSPLGASSRRRWKNCPGSVRLSAGLPSRSSVYAEEGTEAHGYAARWLVEGDRPAGIPRGDKLSFEENMEHHLRGYVKFIRNCFPKQHTRGAEILVEHRFHMPDIHELCYGTADAVIWIPSRKLLIVVDLKYGAGLRVDAYRNEQLLYYALGAFKRYPEALSVVIVVYQPRIDRETEGREPMRNYYTGLLGFPFPIEVADAYHADNDEIADEQDILRIEIDTTARPDALLNPGDWCRFCPAAVTCPEIRRRGEIELAQEFSPVEGIDPAELGRALQFADAVKHWATGVRATADQEAREGRPPVGYKLAEAQSRRHWLPAVTEEDVILALEMEGYFGARVSKTDMLSVPQVEKVTPKAAHKALKGLWKSSSSGLVLVPASSKRKAVTPSTIDAEFTVLTDDSEEDPYA